MSPRAAVSVNGMARRGDAQRAPAEPRQERQPASRERERVQPTVPEVGGPQGPEPTRYGDWEKGGRCTDF